MRVIAITPVHVTDEELERRQARYDRISPDGLKVDLINFSELEPESLETSLDILKSDLGVALVLNSLNRDAFDFLMPDCVLDPGFRQDGDEFVVGMLECVMSELKNSGHQVGSVTRNEAIGAELARRIEEYGYSANFVGNEVINLSFDAISNEDLWHETMQIAVEKLASRGATIVVNGCSAVNLVGARSALEVIDPAEIALRLIQDRKNSLEANYGKI